MEMKEANKDAKIYVGRSMTVHNLLFFAHRLWLNYVTEIFLLVSYTAGRNAKIDYKPIGPII